VERQTQRSAMVDIAKGMAIVLVVYGHCLRGLVLADVLPETSWLYSTDYVVYTFHMPIFFLLSGLFFPSSLRKSPREFWVGRLGNIVYPYFLWSLIHGGFQLALGGTGAVNSPFHLRDLAAIPWKPIPPFWFLYALFFGNVLALLLKRVRTDFVVAAAALAFVAGLHHAPGVLADIAYGFLYFSLGILAREQDWLRRIPPSWAGTAALFLAFLAATAACAALGIPERLPIPAALLGIAFSLFLCTALETTSAIRPVATFFQLVGQCSMSIFVLHILVLGFVRTILLRFLGIHDPLVLMPLAIALAVAAPVVAQILAARLGIGALVGWTVPPMLARTPSPRGPEAT